MNQNHEKLKALVYNGARDKKLAITDNVLDRISFELSVIEKQGFTDYFILYSRIIEVCNEINLLRSFGRGSASNSIVNYCLDVTKINPIEENLIFERFIHPKQISLPDVDIDIPKGTLEKVINLLVNKYPEYQTYYISYKPKEENDYSDISFNDDIFKEHPSGIIISSKNIPNQVFSFNNKKYCLILDYPKDPICEFKFDFIELEYLKRLQLIVNEIGESFHPYNLPLNDKNVFELFEMGDIDNIFQFNSYQHRQIFSEIKPNSIHDLSIINAICRPYLIEYIPTVISNKFNTEKIFKYTDCRVSEILKETYGLLIYFETFLRISNEIAGISFADTEVWRRRILNDKSNNELINFNSMFANGCRENSCLLESEINQLTNMFSKMLGIAFQKSHSLSYSIIGYWGAYYKTYFRKQFDKAFSIESNFQQFELH